MLRVVDARQVSRTQGQQRADAPSAQNKAGQAADDAEHQALGEELAHQTSAAGADGSADGDLPLTRGRAGEQQVRDVGAGDQ